MKKRFYRTKKLLAALLTATLSFSVMGVTAFGAQTVYQQREQETVTRGVTYEKNSRMTTDGIQNIHVVTVDLTESTLELKEVESKKEYGLKETVWNMLADNGAVAGVNSDFFGMSGKYSAPFGPIVRNGELISAGTSINKERNEYGAYIKDEDGKSVFTYFKTSATFGNGERSMELASINKVTSMVYPICFDKNAAATTADLDKRFPGLVKFVVQDGKITYITWKGETVSVPDNGYLIVMSGDYYTNAASGFKVGDDVSMQVSATIDFDKIDTAFGGGGLLLNNGQTAAPSPIVAKGRQPRTAFGVSQDGKKAILMAVDGRGDSIGVTHQEMADLMRSYGAYDAMHLDGGGSTTMAVKTIEDPALEVKNTVSDGAQRKVINAVGVFQKAPVEQIQELVISPSHTHTQPGKAITFTVYGKDQYLHRIPIEPSMVKLEAIGIEGTWNGFNFTPSTTGTFSVRASYGASAQNNEIPIQGESEKTEQEEVATGIENTENITSAADTIDTENLESTENATNETDTESDTQGTADTDNQENQAVPSPAQFAAEVPNIRCDATSRLTVANNDIKISGVGKTAKIYVTANDVNGFGRAVTEDAVYTVGNPAIGTMNGNTFTAKANGSTFIKCSWGGKDTYVTVTVGKMPKVKAPSPSPAGADPMEKSVTKAADGATYINVVGRTSNTKAKAANAQAYNATKERVKAAVGNADTAIYGGASDIQMQSNAFAWNGSYRYLNKGNTGIVMISAANGGIRNTNAWQYNRFTTDVETANNQNIVVVMDKTPGDFSSAAEADYFRAILHKYVTQGKNVFVVSCSGNSYWKSVKDGVRYVNLPNIWRAEGTANSSSYMLKFRIEGTDLSYEVVKI